MGIVAAVLRGLAVIVGLLTWEVLFVWLLRAALAPAPDIWRGTRTNVGPWRSSRGLEVTPRSYIAFLSSIVPFIVGGLSLPPLLAIGTLSSSGGAAIAGGIGAVLMLLFFIGTLLHAIVNAFNRPSWLVPPSRRAEHGWVRRRRDARR
jgi:hypothetical protein